MIPTFNDSKFVHSVEDTWKRGGYSLRFAVTDDGKPTKYFRMLLALEKAGCMSKKEMLRVIMGDRVNHVNIKGYYSTTFSKFSINGVLRYNPADRMWYPGSNFAMFMKLSKRRLVHRVAK